MVLGHMTGLRVGLAQGVGWPHLYSQLKVCLQAAPVGIIAISTYVRVFCVSSDVLVATCPCWTIGRRSVLP